MQLKVVTDTNHLIESLYQSTPNPREEKLIENSYKSLLDAFQYLVDKDNNVTEGNHKF